MACLQEKPLTQESYLSKIFGYVAGFGTAGNTILHWVQHNSRLYLYNTSMCQNVQPHRDKDWNVQFCAGEYSTHGNTSGLCHGDYGAALYARDTINDREKYVAIGILSYDVPCRTMHSPA